MKKKLMTSFISILASVVSAVTVSAAEKLEKVGVVTSNETTEKKYLASGSYPTSQKKGWKHKVRNKRVKATKRK